MTRGILRMLLTEGEHRAVGGTGDGEKAIHQYQPDIVFLDIDMPHVDAHEAAAPFASPAVKRTS